MSDFKISKPKDINEINKMLGDAWLNINVDESTIFNPLETIPRVWEETPELYFTWLMSQPEYFSFVCKEVFNIQLLPMQSLILKELWGRKFPLLIGARGLGKSFLLGLYALLRITFMRQRKVVIVGAAFRQSKVIFEYMETIWNNAPVLRSMCPTSSGAKHEQDMWRFYIGDSVASALPLGDGTKIRGQRANDIINDEFACLVFGSIVETLNGFLRIEDFEKLDSPVLTGAYNVYERPEKFIKTPLCDIYEVKLKNGYVIRCSENHKLMTNDGWKKPLELTNKDFIEQKVGCLNFGNGVDELDEKMAWLIGILISEGCITNHTQISLGTTDKNVCEKLVNEYNFKMKISEAYIDSRGWKCKQIYRLWSYDKELRNQLCDLGLDYVTAHNKKIPWSILKSPKDIIWSFLSGLFEGDGSCFLWNDKSKDCIGLAYYSVSERLCRDVQFLMLKLGFDGYINKRKSNISDNDQWFVRWNSKQAFDSAQLLNVDRFRNAINSCYLPKDPTYISWDKERSKWHVQYKYLDKTIRKRFENKTDAKNFVQDLKNKTKYKQVISVEKLDYQDHLYDYYLPKSHSFYAEGFRQHNSTPREIFENVVAGFGSVSASPIDNVMVMASNLLAEEWGIEVEDDKDEAFHKSNQIILSGTAYYDFNHFAEYWKDWSAIIRTKGDPKRIQDFFNRKAGSKKIERAEVPKDFDWTDYSVIRIPYELIPPGFMDAGQVARSKATIHAGIYEMEYGAVFSSDSNGFYKRSLIETCVGKPNEPISLPSGEVYFGAMIRGNPSMKYVYGVDPASEVDNFTIVILEVHPDHHRIVYVWSTTRKDHREKVKSKLIQETDFYSYCCRQIRDLMKKFPCERIALDAQGGGIAVIEGLHDQDKIHVGELPIWPTIDPEKEKDTDGESGLHIVEMIQFASADWTCDANNGLRKDFEDKVTLFPHFDGLELSVAANKDSLMGRLYDTLEDCMLDIEELKDELSTIIISRTPSGREKWDTPEIKLPGNKKGRQRKDRYSSLLMANMVARQLVRDVVFQMATTDGGFADNVGVDGGMMYQGPAWFTEKIQGVY